MALINCPNCGCKMSDRADACPKCGTSIKGYSKPVTHASIQGRESEEQNFYKSVLHLIELEQYEEAFVKIDVLLSQCDYPDRYLGLKNSIIEKWVGKLKNDADWCLVNNDVDKAIKMLSQALLLKPNDVALQDTVNTIKLQQSNKNKKLYIIAAVVVTLLLVGLSAVWLFNKKLRKDGSMETFVVNGISFNMVKVDGGTFTMGATEEMDSPSEREKPAHTVTLSTYYIGQTEVTQELWENVMGNNPSDLVSEGLPVESVSWDDCQDFIAKLNTITGKNFRLPTEAEWEFAARGGNKSRHTRYSGSDNIDEVAWYSENSQGYTHPVSSKSANELGIYDMTGNVDEWCEDWEGKYESESQINPKGPEFGTFRVLRGGGLATFDVSCTSSFRHSEYPDSRYPYIGLRLAFTE